VQRSDLEAAILELTALLDQPEAPERSFQSYFENRSLVFGVLGYECAVSRPRLPLASGSYMEPDFLGQLFSGGKSWILRHRSSECF
jgi:hypothetical protein